VEAKQQAGQLGWPGEAEPVGPADASAHSTSTARASARGDGDAHVGPRLALYATRNHVQRTVVPQECGPRRRNQRP
jgi:hypothetical protein